MPYSFTQIEKDKTKTIGFVFSFLIFFYFLTGLLIAVIFKNYLFWESFSEREQQVQYTISSLTIGETFSALLIALFIGGVHWLFSIQNLLPKMLKVIGARPLNPNDSYHQMLKNIIDEVSVATGGKKMEGVVVPTMAMNAFALADYNGNAVIGVTEGLLSRLSRAQIEAVVGHEAAHIVSGDCLSTTVTTSLFAVYNGVLNGLSQLFKSERRYSSRGRGSAGGSIAVLLLLIYLVLLVTRFLSLLVRMFISREREFRADAVSVRLTRDPLSLAEALYLISCRWRGAGMSGEELEAIFIVNPEFSKLDEGTGLFSDLFSTHPPVHKRLDVLLDLAKADLQSLENTFQNTLNRPKETIPDTVVPVAPTTAGPAAGSLAHQWMLYKDGRIPEPLANHCPRCFVPLVQKYYEGVPIRQCSLCAGVFVGQDDVQRIIIREKVGFSDRIERMAKVIEDNQRSFTEQKPLNLKGQNNIPCPSTECQIQKYHLIKSFYTEAYRIEVDKCINCGHIWFDKDELEILQYMIEKTVNEGI